MRNKLGGFALFYVRSFRIQDACLWQLLASCSSFSDLRCRPAAQSLKTLGTEDDQARKRRRVGRQAVPTLQVMSWMTPTRGCPGHYIRPPFGFLGLIRTVSLYYLEHAQFQTNFCPKPLRPQPSQSCAEAPAGGSRCGGAGRRKAGGSCRSPRWGWWCSARWLGYIRLEIGCTYSRLQKVGTWMDMSCWLSIFLRFAVGGLYMIRMRLRWVRDGGRHCRGLLGLYHVCWVWVVG